MEPAKTDGTPLPVATPPPPTVLVDGELTEAFVEQAEKGIELHKRLDAVARKATFPTDWIDMGGAPYLKDSGVSRVARVFRVSCEPVGEVRREDETIEGRRIVRYFATVRATDATGRCETQIGSASSADPFFGIRRGELVPLAEVDLGDVAKKSLTNAKGRAVRALLGLDGLGWADVKDAGHDRNRMQAVQYGKTKSASGVGELNSVKKRLAEMVFDLAEGDEEAARDLLEDLTTFEGQDGRTVPGKRDVRQLSDKWAESTAKKVEDRWREKMQPSGPPPPKADEEPETPW